MEEHFSNKEVARLLRNIAAVYLLQNVNRFRIIAYENAATSIEHLTREIKDIWQDGKLTQVSGIGPTIAQHLDEYFKNGKSEHFEHVLSGIPATVFSLMNVPGLGPKKAYKLVNALKLHNVKTIYEDLRKAGEAGKIETLETFGKKSQDDILQSLELFKSRKSKEKRMPLPYATMIAENVVEYLKHDPAIKQIDVLGSLRRQVSTIGDVDVAVMAEEKDTAHIIDYFTKYPKRLSVDNAGGKKSSIIVSPYVRVDLRVQTKKQYGSMLQYFTGSKNHNILLREYALSKGYSLNEYGFKTVGKSEKPLKEFDDEKDLYGFLGLQFIPPEIREGTDEVVLARQNKISKLVELTDIKGDLHLHSSYDLKPSHDLGKNTYEEILDYAKEKKYEYVGFADHNPKISGLSKNKVLNILKKRKEFIDKTCKNHPVKYFVGLEVDILPSGEPAIPAGAEEYLDYMIVSVHSVFNMNVADMTKRVLKALAYPKVKILGHPTGRLLGSREGFELDWPQIFSFCAKKNIGIEINSWPERLDLPDTLVREAQQIGVSFVINTDAHANYQMDNMRYGVSVARRGWATKNDISNAKEYNEFRKWIDG